MDDQSCSAVFLTNAMIWMKNIFHSTFFSKKEYIIYPFKIGSKRFLPELKCIFSWKRTGITDNCTCTLHQGPCFQRNWLFILPCQCLLKSVDMSDCFLEFLYGTLHRWLVTCWRSKSRKLRSPFLCNHHQLAKLVLDNKFNFGFNCTHSLFN